MKAVDVAELEQLAKDRSFFMEMETVPFQLAESKSFFSKQSCFLMITFVKFLVFHHLRQY